MFPGNGCASKRGSNRVNRGGSFNNTAANCRSANRTANQPTNRNNTLGLRPTALILIERNENSTRSGGDQKRIQTGNTTVTTANQQSAARCIVEEELRIERRRSGLYR